MLFCIVLLFIEFASTPSTIDLASSCLSARKAHKSTTKDWEALTRHAQAKIGYT